MLSNSAAMQMTTSSVLLSFLPRHLTHGPVWASLYQPNLIYSTSLIHSSPLCSSLNVLSKLVLCYFLLPGRFPFSLPPLVLPSGWEVKTTYQGTGRYTPYGKLYIPNNNYSLNMQLLFNLLMLFSFNQTIKDTGVFIIRTMPFRRAHLNSYSNMIGRFFR